MSRTVIMLLEDNPDRLRDFEAAVAQLGYKLRTWRDANRMIAECHEVLPETALISLNHDLNKEHEDSPDTGRLRSFGTASWNGGRRKSVRVPPGVSHGIKHPPSFAKNIREAGHHPFGGPRDVVNSPAFCEKLFSPPKPSSMLLA